MKARCGSTLIEMLVVIALLGLALSMISTLLAATMRITRSVTDEQLTRTHTARLAARLRGDAHASSKVEINNVDDGQSACSFIGDGDAIVRYESTDEGLVREVRNGDETNHRDLFALPHGTRASFELLDSHSGQVIKLQLQPSLNAKTLRTTGARCQIEAAIGLDRRPLETAVAQAEDAP